MNNLYLILNIVPPKITIIVNFDTNDINMDILKERNI